MEVEEVVVEEEEAGAEGEREGTRVAGGTDWVGVGVVAAEKEGVAEEEEEVVVVEVEAKEARRLNGLPEVMRASV